LFAKSKNRGEEKDHVGWREEKKGVPRVFDGIALTSNPSGIRTPGGEKSSKREPGKTGGSEGGGAAIYRLVIGDFYAKNRRGKAGR